MLSLLSSFGIIAIKITHRNPDQLHGKITVHRADALLRFEVPKNPAQSPMHVPAIFALQGADVSHFFQQRRQYFQGVSFEVFSDIKKHASSPAIESSWGAHKFQGKLRLRLYHEAPPDFGILLNLFRNRKFVTSTKVPRAGPATWNTCIFYNLAAACDQDHTYGSRLHHGSNCCFIMVVEIVPRTAFLQPAGLQLRTGE
jgi:hypothetical protein